VKSTTLQFPTSVLSLAAVVFSFRALELVRRDEIVRIPVMRSVSVRPTLVDACVLAAARFPLAATRIPLAANKDSARSNKDSARGSKVPARGNKDSARGIKGSARSNKDSARDPAEHHSLL